MDMFLKASRLQIRYDLGRGPIMVEDLWDLPLTSTRGPSLDGIAKYLNRMLKDDTNVSFVETAAVADPNHTQLKFDIVKTIIDIKIAENKAAASRKARADMKQKIMEVIASKQDDALKNRSLEELQAMLAEEEAAA